MVLNAAHRGARSLAPENTLAAARRAHELGADLWEADAAVTADDELILFHDDSLARTTDAEARFPGRGPWTYTAFTFEELRSLDLGSRFLETDPFGQVAAGAVRAEGLKGERIPSLREALAFTREKGWRMNLELKRLPPPKRDFPIVESVLKAVEESGIPPSDVVLSSFHHPWLREAAELRPDIEVQALLGWPLDVPIRWGSLEFDVYNVRQTMTTPEEVRSIVAKGRTVNVFVVNEQEDMRRWIGAGASALFTDFPQRLAALLKEGA